MIARMIHLIMWHLLAFLKMSNGYSNTLDVLGSVRIVGKSIFLLGFEPLSRMGKVRSLLSPLGADDNSCSLRKKQGEADSSGVTEYQFKSLQKRE